MEVNNEPMLNVDEQYNDKTFKGYHTLMIQIKFKKLQLPKPT